MKASTPIVSLEEIGLPLTREELWDLYQPFVQRCASGDDEEWRADVARLERKIWKHYLRRRLLGESAGQVRSEEMVKEDYERVWNKITYEQYAAEAKNRGYVHWEWNGKHMYASNLGVKRIVQLMLIRLIEKLRPRRVLEVGCGNGINLLLLAGQFPEISFTGLELTAMGHRQAKALQAEDRLPDHLADFAPLPLKDSEAFRRIEFVNGSASDMPFEAESFDLVYSVMALEQMERIRDAAFREISRVAKGSVFMFEPFRDVNRSGPARRNVVRLDYLQAWIDDFREYGLEPEFATADFPQKLHLKACATLCRKRTSASQQT